MNFSFGKTVWKTFSKFLSTLLWLFLFVDLAILVLIFLQEKFDWNQLFTILTLNLCLFSLTNLVTAFPILIQLIYFPFFLFFYLEKGFQILLSVPLKINYNFVWSSPKIINNLVGFPVQGKVIDFIFWSGLIYTLFIFALQLQHWLLVFLSKVKVGFAVEIWEEEKAKLIAQKKAYLEVQAKAKPLSKKEKIIKAIWYLFVIFFLSGLLVLGVFLFQEWENRKYPLLWKTSFPGTAICYWDKCGQKGALLPQKIKPGELWTTSFLLNKENKKLILELRASIQPVVKPEVSLEIELESPDQKRVFYLSKEDIIKGSVPDSPNKNSFFSKRFNFIADKPGKYTLKVTSYTYGIAYIDILVRDINID